MKTLTDTILFTLIVVSFIIAVHQLMVNGISFAYPIFMLSVAMLFLYWYRKAQAKQKEEEAAKKAKPRKKRK